MVPMERSTFFFFTFAVGTETSQSYFISFILFLCCILNLMHSCDGMKYFILINTQCQEDSIWLLLLQKVVKSTSFEENFLKLLLISYTSYVQEHCKRKHL